MRNIFFIIVPPRFLQISDTMTSGAQLTSQSDEARENATEAAEEKPPLGPAGFSGLRKIREYAHNWPPAGRGP